jgi:hypothetical protein
MRGASRLHSCFRGSSADPDHDAAMRIGVGLQPADLICGEVPGGGHILLDGVGAMPASDHRHLRSLSGPDRECRGGAPDALRSLMSTGCSKRRAQAPVVSH